MGALVLYYDLWPAKETAKALAKAVAAPLGARATGLDKRPHMGLYDLVVLVAPVAALADPRITWLAACGELAGKTLAIVSDAPGPWPGAFFAPWASLATLAGGVRMYEEPLHLGPWLPGREPKLAEAEAWGARLAQAFPPPAYPRGDAGRRDMRP